MGAAALVEPRSPKLSPSERLSAQLSLGKARHLEGEAWSMVPKIFEGLVRQGRTDLMEIASRQDSSLSRQIQDLRGSLDAAVSCSIHDGCDLGTDSGVRLVLQRLELERPAHVWIRPTVGPYSPLQNNNCQTEEQKRELQNKREKVMREYVGACVVFRACMQQGTHVSLEMAERCQAWRLPIFSQLRDQCKLHQAVCKGCRVNLRNQKGLLLQKGWRILTTHRRLAASLNLPCRCSPQYKHGQCTGGDANPSEVYTKEFAQRAAKGILQELDHVSLLQEVQGQGISDLPQVFGQDCGCQCKQVSLPQRPRRCANCLSNPKTDDQEGFWLEQAEEQDWSCVASEVEVEQVAARVLKHRDFQHETCEQLLDLIPCRQHEGHRGMLDPQSRMYLIFGAYSYGNQYGITKRTQRYPNVVSYLVAYLQYWSPEPLYGTSLVVNYNGRCPMHRDQHNDNQYPNSVIGLGTYQGGQLWVENQGSQEKGEGSASLQALPNGQRAPGRLLDIYRKVQTFSPKAWHGPQAWKGNRVVVGLYVTRGHGHLSEAEREELQRLGFKLPKREPERQSPEHALVPASARDGLVFTGECLLEQPIGCR